MHKYFQSTNCFLERTLFDRAWQVMFAPCIATSRDLDWIEKLSAAIPHEPAQSVKFPGGTRQQIEKLFFLAGCQHLKCHVF